MAFCALSPLISAMGAEMFQNVIQNVIQKVNQIPGNHNIQNQKELL